MYRLTFLDTPFHVEIAADSTIIQFSEAVLSEKEEASNKGEDVVDTSGVSEVVELYLDLLSQTSV